jgi:hypothetical protein
MKNHQHKVDGFVGRTGFEPATPWSQTKYSTGLNYLPKLTQSANKRDS